MTKYIISIFLCCALTTFGQVNKIKVKKQNFISAAFPGGKDSLTRYLNKNVNEVISADLSLRQKVQKPTNVEAIVNLSPIGKIEKIQLIKSFLDPKIDTLFITSIKNMPTWIPATNELGNNCNDKQTISFIIQTMTVYRVRSWKKKSQD